MNKQQIIHQLFCLSNQALIDGEDWKDLNKPQAPFVTIRLCLVSEAEYTLFYGEDLINEKPFTYQFVDEYLFPETSLDECSFLFDRLQNSLSTSRDNLGDIILRPDRTTSVILSCAPTGQPWKLAIPSFLSGDNLKPFLCTNLFFNPN